MRHLIIKKKTWLHSWWVTIPLIFFVLLGMVSLIKTYMKQREALSLRNEARRELISIEQKHQELDKKINDLSTDYGIEAEVRERYRVVKPGEQLVIVIDNDNPNKKGDSSVKSAGFLEKLRLFVGL